MKNDTKELLIWCSGKDERPDGQIIAILKDKHGKVYHGLRKILINKFVAEGDNEELVAWAYLEQPEEILEQIKENLR